MKNAPVLESPPTLQPRRGVFRIKKIRPERFLLMFRDYAGLYPPNSPQCGCWRLCGQIGVQNYGNFVTCSRDTAAGGNGAAWQAIERPPSDPKAFRGNTDANDAAVAFFARNSRNPVTNAPVPEQLKLGDSGQR